MIRLADFLVLSLVLSDTLTLFPRFVEIKGAYGLELGYERPSPFMGGVRAYDTAVRRVENSTRGAEGCCNV